MDRLSSDIPTEIPPEFSTSTSPTILQRDIDGNFSNNFNSNSVELPQSTINSNIATFDHSEGQQIMPSIKQTAPNIGSSTSLFPLRSSSFKPRGDVSLMATSASNQEPMPHLPIPSGGVVPTSQTINSILTNLEKLDLQNQKYQTRKPHAMPIQIDSIASSSKHGQVVHAADKTSGSLSPVATHGSNSLDIDFNRVNTNSASNRNSTNMEFVEKTISSGGHSPDNRQINNNSNNYVIDSGNNGNKHTNVNVNYNANMTIPNQIVNTSLNNSPNVSLAHTNTKFDLLRFFKPKVSPNNESTKAVVDNSFLPNDPFYDKVPGDIAGSNEIDASQEYISSSSEPIISSQKISTENDKTIDSRNSAFVIPSVIDDYDGSEIESEFTSGHVTHSSVVNSSASYTDMGYHKKHPLDSVNYYNYNQDQFLEDPDVSFSTSNKQSIENDVEISTPPSPNPFVASTWVKNSSAPAFESSALNQDEYHSDEFQDLAQDASTSGINIVPSTSHHNDSIVNNEFSLLPSNSEPMNSLSILSAPITPSVPSHHNNSPLLNSSIIEQSENPILLNVEKVSDISSSSDLNRFHSISKRPSLLLRRQTVASKHKSVSIISRHDSVVQNKRHSISVDGISRDVGLSGNHQNYSQPSSDAPDPIPSSTTLDSNLGQEEEDIFDLIDPLTYVPEVPFPPDTYDREYYLKLQEAVQIQQNLFDIYQVSYQQLLSQFQNLQRLQVSLNNMQNAGNDQNNNSANNEQSVDNNETNIQSSTHEETHPVTDSNNEASNESVSVEITESAVPNIPHESIVLHPTPSSPKYVRSETPMPSKNSELPSNSGPRKISFTGDSPPSSPVIPSDPLYVESKTIDNEFSELNRTGNASPPLSSQPVHLISPSPSPQPFIASQSPDVLDSTRKDNINNDIFMKPTYQNDNNPMLIPSLPTEAVAPINPTVPPPISQIPAINTVTAIAGFPFSVIPERVESRQIEAVSGGGLPVTVEPKPQILEQIQKAGAVRKISEWVAGVVALAATEDDEDDDEDAEDGEEYEVEYENDEDDDDEYDTEDDEVNMDENGDSPNNQESNDNYNGMDVIAETEEEISVNNLGDPLLTEPLVPLELLEAKEWTDWSEWTIGEYASLIISDEPIPEEIEISTSLETHEQGKIVWEWELDEQLETKVDDWWVAISRDDALLVMNSNPHTSFRLRVKRRLVKMLYPLPPPVLELKPEPAQHNAKSKNKSKAKHKHEDRKKRKPKRKAPRPTTWMQQPLSEVDVDDSVSRIGVPASLLNNAPMVRTIPETAAAVVEAASKAAAQIQRQLKQKQLLQQQQQEQQQQQQQ